MDFTPEPYDEATFHSWLFCKSCGTQFPTSDRSAIKTCAICDDPRNYVPPSGQTFTTLTEARTANDQRNVFAPYEHDPRLISIRTVPKLGIGQRAILVRTPSGSNILWDCITLLDEETITRINDLGGLAAIVISHPHFYSSHVAWAQAFQCPVYIAAEDERWTTMPSAHRRLLTDTDTEIAGTGARAIKLGGHFPGSMVLLFEKYLLVADTLMTTGSGIGSWDTDAAGEQREKPPGHNTFAFMWSIPNYIPLSADDIWRMWGILKKYEFSVTLGPFDGSDIEDEQLKERVLESMKIQMRAMGHESHALLNETL